MSLIYREKIFGRNCKMNEEKSGIILRKLYLKEVVQYEGNELMNKRQMKDCFVQKQVPIERKLCKEEKGIKY